MRHGDKASGSGYTFVAVLILLAVVSTGLAVAGPTWAQQGQRERERELLRIGALYAQALASYRDASPGSAKQYPQTLDALLLDTRFIGTRRHLRKLYPDPVTGVAEWGIVRDEEGRILGVHSLSHEAPLIDAEVVLDDRVLPSARKYSDWKFIAKAN